MSGEKMNECLQQILPTKAEIIKWFEADGEIYKDFEAAGTDLWTYIYNVTAGNLEKLKNKKILYSPEYEGMGL